ncbi:hypothetical protein GZH47_09735 [Paenibacillus rhizovicinus]|uniref:Beta-agarase n=1 Tax=Paenibacillus rhizovicinus TaxID=2704463 RepID=A0A6C0NY28_9BACL|nr:hypothetical protein [Paenibacillus rhizovicinus]QHW31108.1 hypothetical protein GZH47_09735 [Paenibacillus rhizovicinus]
MTYSGYFTVSQQNGRWQLVDGNGAPFYSLGVNCFNHGIGIPMEEKLSGKYGGEGWHARWAEEKREEVWELGFNTMAAWHDRYFFDTGLPRTYEVRCSRYAKMANNGWGGYGFPDVFDPSFRDSCERAAAEAFGDAALNLAEDRSVIGLYTDNELHWWGSGGQWGMDDPGQGTNRTNLVEDYIKLPPDACGKQAWIAFLEERYKTIESLNEGWGAEYGSFGELSWLKQYRAAEAVYLADKTAFLAIIAELYFSTTTEALRKYDRHHLILGCRVVGTSTPDTVLKAMGKYADVMSINFYAFELPVQWLQRAHEMTGKPMMVTEFSFCCGQSAGFDLVTNGAQLVNVRDQKRRGECYRAFVTQAAELPYMVGTHWFSLYDFWDRQGLIGNYGLYDKEDRPWTEFTEAVRDTHRAILAEKLQGKL